MTRNFSRRHTTVVLAAVSASLALTLAACSSGGGSTTTATTPAAADTATTPAAADTTTPAAADTTAAAPTVEGIDCAAYQQFGDLKGKTVHVYTSIVDPEGATQIASYKPFEDCTGVKIDYESSREFEAQVLVRVKAGNAPDIAYLPQPGLLQQLVQDTGKVVPAPKTVADLVDKNWTASWKDYGTVNGTFYAAPLGANMKSFVWYSPKAFKDAGYEVPKTWDEMMTLTQKIADSGTIPWCAGIESGDATGWPATDWIEDVMLRTAGPDVYTQWWKHEIPFNDPRVATAFDTAGKILKDPKFVNGGFGDVASIATTPWTDAGFPIPQGQCYMSRAANFYATQWKAPIHVADDPTDPNAVFAFYMPTNQTDVKPILGGGEFVAAFNDRPEVQAFQTYLATADWANNKAKATPDGGWVSANMGLDINNLAVDFDKASAAILIDPKSVLRFDASDLMPGAVGAGTFWTGMVDWINGADTKTVLDKIEASWPKS